MGVSSEVEAGVGAIVGAIAAARPLVATVAFGVDTVTGVVGAGVGAAQTALNVMLAGT